MLILRPGMWLNTSYPGDFLMKPVVDVQANAVITLSA